MRLQSTRVAARRSMRHCCCKQALWEHRHACSAEPGATRARVGQCRQHRGYGSVNSDFLHYSLQSGVAHVVSERGEQWSPQTEPERMDAMVPSMRSSSPPATATLRVATGNMMATAHTPPAHDPEQTALTLSEVKQCWGTSEAMWWQCLRRGRHCHMHRGARSRAVLATCLLAAGVPA